MNMRKIIAVLSAVLMLCAIIPMGVFAAPGDVIIDADFNDGTDGFNNFSAVDGALVLDGTSANWANAYAYANNIKPSTTYQVNFRAKADTNKSLAFKINNGWSGTNVQESATITTEWQEFELLLTPDSSLTSPIFTIQTSTYASGGTVYYIDYVKVTEYQDPAEIGKVVNGSFEDGIANWKTDSSASLYTNDASAGNNSLKLENTGYYASAATQTVPVKANTVYKLSWKSKRLSGTGAFNVILCQPVSPYTNFTKVEGQNWMNETSGNWVDNSFVVNTGDNTSMLIKWTSERSGDAGAILLDDIKLIEIKDPSFDGYIYNGDFEAGKTAPWENLWGSTALELVEDRNGGYALKGTASGEWKIVYQEVDVTPNTNYTVWAYAKDASSSALWIKNAGGNGDITSKNFASGSEWTKNEVSFNSGSNETVWVGLMVLAAGGTYTVDDVFMFEAQPESNDGYFKNGTFETGSANNWTAIWSNQVAASIVTGGKDSTFAAYVYGKGTEQWGQFRQKVAVEPNTDYKVTVWAKNSSGMSLLVKTGDDSANINNVGANAGEEWTLITNEFNSGNNTSVNVGVMVEVAGASGTFDNFMMEKLHTCNVVEQERVDATCTTDGYVKYACDCGLGEYTETITAKGHTAGAAADCTNAQVCTVCGAEMAAALGHDWADATCTAPKTCTKCGATEGEALGHTYFDDCSAICDVCGYEREVSHNIVHVEAVAPTCTATGNIEYWYCDACGMAWLDEACTLNTNLRAVNLPMADHTYDNEYDVDCNVCGAIREVDLPVVSAGTSVSEEVSGVAVKFAVSVEGLAVVEGSGNVADYTNASIDGNKLISMGVVASNRWSSTDIPCVYLCDLDETSAAYATRIINIPDGFLDSAITFQSYFVVEIDGVETTVYADSVSASYNSASN